MAIPPPAAPAPAAPAPAAPALAALPRPVPGSRAVVHIGLHKTATTLIQFTLANNRAHLAAHGADYPRTGPGPAHHGLLCLWHEMHPAWRSPEDPRALWAGLAAHAAPGRTLLLSSEVFARAAPPRANLGQLRTLLAAYAEIRLVCVLREPVGLIQSLVLQVARVAPLDLARAIRMALAEGRAEGVAVDRMRLHARLRADFAAHEIVYLDHAGFPRTATGPAAAVLAAAGVPAAAGKGLVPPPAAAAHPSWPPLPTWLVHEARGPALLRDPAHAPAARAAAQALLDARFGAGRPTTLFTRAEWRTLAAHFAPLEAAFAAARAAEGQPAPAAGPASPPDPDSPAGRAFVWRDDLDAGFLAAAAAALPG